MSIASLWAVVILKIEIYHPLENSVIKLAQGVLEPCNHESYYCIHYFILMIIFLFSRSIGYPMVSLGYGFKSYVGCRMKQYKQEDVSKENDFYHQLIAYALPLELMQRQTTDKGRSTES